MKKLFIIFLTTLGFQVFTLANSSVEIKTELSNTVCSVNSTIVYIDLFIKKADHVSGNLKLKNQNYRLNYDAGTLEFDSFFIDSEGAVSNYGNNPDQSIFLFDRHTLTGTTEHILSYNVNLQGGDGFELSQDWVLIGTIGASLRTNTECFSSLLIKENDFPSTVLIYDIDDSHRIIDKDPVSFDLNECILDHCNICHPNLNLNTIEHNYTNGELLNHQVQDYINADNIIGNNSNITFDVTNHALLNAGFEVNSNAVFEIKLDGCQ